MTTKRSSSGIIQWIAVAVLVAAMFSASKRAALPALLAIVRFFWPLLLVWLIWKFLKAKVSGAVGKFQEQVMAAAGQNAAQRRGPAGAGGEVLDLCPKCGVLLTSSHRCQ